MSFSPNNLRKHLSKHGDLSKPSKFKVEIFASGSTKGNIHEELNKKSRELTFQCEATELPGYTVNTSESKVYGPSWHVATVPTFTDISLTFICAGDMWEKKFFDDWMNSIVPVAFGGLGTAASHPRYRDDYICDIKIYQYVDTNSTKYVYGCILEEAFPTNIGALAVNWGDTDGVHRLAVSFKYTRWKRLVDGLFNPTSYSNEFNEFLTAQNSSGDNVQDGVRRGTAANEGASDAVRDSAIGPQ